MTKTKSQFLCRSCGSVHPRWMGKCPDCGTWDSLEQFLEPKPLATPHASLVESWSKPGEGVQQAAPLATPLPEIESANVARLPSGLSEFDRVLGGGFVPGSVVLLGGDPGIGKSTLLLQAAGRMAGPECRVLFVTSEESAYQTRLRAERLFEPERGSGLAGDLSHLYVLADTNLARIAEQAGRIQPALLIIDSIQMIYRSDLDAAPGSVSQLRRCCTELVYLAKVSGMATVVVGHVTKDGQLAGPKLLEHLVDAVLSFDGDRDHAHRIVRGIKNRYGTTLEVGLFEMTGQGLREVEDASSLLDPQRAPLPGSVICPALLGTRSMLVELQALTATGFLGAAKRRTSGLDGNRLAMLIAVLEQHGGLRLADQDIFVSAVGGLRVLEPAADLALALAIAGAHRRRALPAGTAVVGEVGLGGEVRPVRQLEQRATEAMRRGYQRLVVPVGGRSAPDGAMVVRTVGEALDLLQ